jgi:DNA polymerase/3'-5' exonuclease PolX
MKEFMKVYGIGPISANKFYDQGFRTIEDLRNKENLTDAQRSSLRYHDHLQHKIHNTEIAYILGVFKKLFPTLEIVIAGSYRRGEVWSNDIDVLIKNRDSGTPGSSGPSVDLEDIIRTLKFEGLLIADLSQGTSKYLGIFQLVNNLAHRIDILLINEESWGTALLYFTGSKRFNILMRQYAKEIGLRLNEYGLYQNGVKVNTPKEEDVFDVLGLRYLAPSERTRDLVHLDLRV